MWGTRTLTATNRQGLYKFICMTLMTAKNVHVHPELSINSKYIYVKYICLWKAANISASFVWICWAVRHMKSRCRCPVGYIRQKRGHFKNLESVCRICKVDLPKELRRHSLFCKMVQFCYLKNTLKEVSGTFEKLILKNWVKYDKFLLHSKKWVSNLSTNFFNCIYFRYIFLFSLHIVIFLTHCTKWQQSTWCNKSLNDSS